MFHCWVLWNYFKFFFQNCNATYIFVIYSLYYVTLPSFYWEFLQDFGTEWILSQVLSSSVELICEFHLLSLTVISSKLHVFPLKVKVSLKNPINSQILINELPTQKWKTHEEIKNITLLIVTNPTLIMSKEKKKITSEGKLKILNIRPIKKTKMWITSWEYNSYWNGSQFRI